MITGHDFYTVMTAMLPLYVAMVLAYGSVRWWKIFTLDQCSGINRFVAIFAVPLLSFHFISLNNPYTMNFRFIVADTLQKIIMLVLLGLWANFTKNGSLEWMITIFSLSTLPNTLVMGIPLLVSMYGEFSGSLMVQVVVLQCIVWYTLLLFLFEYRGAKLLIMERFPETAASIASFKVESDVVSLDGHDFLETDVEVAEDGKLHVVVRTSNASRRSVGLGSVHPMTPRPSNLTGAEIYSVRSSFDQADFYSITGFPGGRLSNFSPADMYSVHSSRALTPRPSNFEESTSPNAEITLKKTTKNQQSQPQPFPQPQQQKNGSHHGISKEPHMIVRSSSVPTASKGGGVHVFRGTDFGGTTKQPCRPDQHGAKEIRMEVSGEIKETVKYGREDFRHGGDIDGDADKIGLNKLASSSAAEGVAAEDGAARKQMPPASVMTRLILIMVWRKLIRNPNTYSSLLGLIWSLVSFRWHVGMPKILQKSISILSDTGLGMAMFSLGLFMALQPKLIACGNKRAMFAMAVRFSIGPAVMAVSSIVLGIRGTLLRVAIVQAALPEGIVPFVFAKEYNVHPTILSTAVIFGMFLTLPVTLVYYILLGL